MEPRFVETLGARICIPREGCPIQRYTNMIAFINGKLPSLYY